MHSCRTVSCLRTYEGATEIRASVITWTEGRKASHGRTCLSPLTSTTQWNGWNRSNESVIVLSSTRTRITPLTSLTLDTYRKMFPARCLDHCQRSTVPCIWLSSLSWTRQRLTAFKARSVTVTLSTGRDRLAIYRLCSFTIETKVS